MAFKFAHLGLVQLKADEGNVNFEFALHITLMFEEATKLFAHCMLQVLPGRVPPHAEALKPGMPK